MAGIDVSNTHGDFGPLSLKFNKTLVISDKQGKTYYKNILMYVWTSLLRVHQSPNLTAFKSWKSGFDLYLEQYQIQFFKKSKTSNKKIKLYHLPNKDEKINTEQRSVEAILRQLPLMLEILEPSIEALKLLKNLLEAWDDIEVEEEEDAKEEDEFISMKKSLNAVLNDSQNLSKLDKFITFFRQLPITYNVNNIKIIEDTLQDITDDLFDMNKQEFRELLIQAIDTITDNTMNEIKDINTEIKTLKEKQKKFEEIKWLTRSEVYTQKWKPMTKEEKTKYYRDLEPIFKTYYHQTILNIFKTHLKTVYSELLNFYENKNLLLQYVRNLKGKNSYININYGPRSIPSIKNLVYIDPFSNFNPYFGVGIHKLDNGDEELRGPNNVGEVLVDLGRNVARDLKRLYIEKQKNDMYKSKLEFYTVYTRLSEILRERDITEFLNLSINEILNRFQHAYNIQLKNRSVTVYIDCNKYDCIHMNETTLQQALQEIGYEPYLVNGKLRWFKQAKNMLEKYSERVIEFIFENNTDNIYELYKYEQTNPGSVVKHLRKLYLPSLYLDQVAQEKNSVMKAVFGFIYLVDPKGRIEPEAVQNIVDFELSQLDSLEYSTLLNEIDTSYVNGELEEFIPDGFPKFIDIDGEEKTIDTYVDWFLDKDKENGYLVKRISKDTVDKAKQFKFLLNNFVDESNEPDLPEEEQPLQNISSRDTNVLTMFKDDHEETQEEEYSFRMNKDYGKKVGKPYSHIESKYERQETDLIVAKQNKIHNIDNNTIVFSSIPNQYTYFPLTPTNRKLCTIDFFKFPTVIHAVYYLWYAKSFGYDQLKTYKKFIKEDWLVLFEKLQIFAAQKTLILEEIYDILLDHGFNEITTELKNITKDSIEISSNELKSVLFNIVINETDYRPFIELYELHSMFINDLDKVVIQNTQHYLKIAYNARFNSNKQYKELLLKTGSVPLFYKSKDDSILGTGPTGNGHNLAGRILMEFREKFRSESTRIYEFSDVQLQLLTQEISSKLYLYGNNLLNIIKSHIDDNDLILKLLRGFLILYQINCGEGEQPNWQLINILTPVVNDITKNSHMKSNLKGLLWDYIKILYSHYERLAITGKNVNKKCLFNTDHKNITKAKKEKATHILTKFLQCLFDIFNTTNTQKAKLSSLVTEIIESNIGRTEYIANLSIRKLNDNERDAIIAGKVNYFDMKIKTASKILEDNSV